jgi:hypothetical protein
LLGSYHGQHGTFDAAWGPSTQHCERSEAIQALGAKPDLDCFVALRAPRNDEVFLA